VERAAREPAAVAADVVLLLPDRQGALDLLDDDAAMRASSFSASGTKQS
jgi:hypothetical protein